MVKKNSCPDIPLRIVPAEERHYDAFLSIYNDCFLPKYYFVIGGEQHKRSIVDDLGILDFSIKGKHYAAIEGESVLGIIILMRRDQKDTLKPRLSGRELLKKYGLSGFLRAFLLFLLFNHRPKRSELYIDSIGVSREARGKGLGSGMLEAVKEIARKENFSSITLSVMYENERAKALYQRHGFTGQFTRDSAWLKKYTGYSGYTFMRYEVM